MRYHLAQQSRSCSYGVSKDSSRKVLSNVEAIASFGNRTAKISQYQSIEAQKSSLIASRSPASEADLCTRVRESRIDTCTYWSERGSVWIIVVIIYSSIVKQQYNRRVNNFVILFFFIIFSAPRHKYLYNRILVGPKLIHHAYQMYRNSTICHVAYVTTVLGHRRPEMYEV